MAAYTAITADVVTNAATGSTDAAGELAALDRAVLEATRALAAKLALSAPAAAQQSAHAAALAIAVAGLEA